MHFESKGRAHMLRVGQSFGSYIILPSSSALTTNSRPVFMPNLSLSFLGIVTINTSRSLALYALTTLYIFFPLTFRCCCVFAFKDALRTCIDSCISHALKLVFGN